MILSRSVSPEIWPNWKNFAKNISSKGSSQNYFQKFTKIERNFYVFFSEKDWLLMKNNVPGVENGPIYF